MRDARRPRILWILLWLCFGQAATYLTYFVLYTLHAEMALGLVETMLMEGIDDVQQYLSIILLSSTWGVLGIASVIVGVGLRRGRPWAWLAAMTLEGAILILSLEAYFLGQANRLFYVGMVIAVAFAFMLNQREIQIYFRANRPEPIRGPFGR